MACNCNYLLFFVWLFIVKTDKHLLLLWLCNYYSLNTIVSWLVNRKITELYISPRNTLVAQRVKSLQCGRNRFDPWVGKIPWRRKWQPTALFLSRKSHGRRSLAGYSPWGCKELDTTEETSLHIYHQNSDPTEKPVITFWHPDACQNHLEIFWKIQILRYWLFFFLQSSRYVTNEQSCLKTTLYDDLLLLSSLFHIFYFIFSAPISFSLCSQVSPSLFFQCSFLSLYQVQ